MSFKPKKSLGQHFLKSKHALDQIISAAKIQHDEIILEIGPGTGILTETLLKTGAKVIAVEKDKRAVELLKEKFSDTIRSGLLELIEGDILEPNLFITQHSSILNGKYAIIANIPYYITGAILEKFLEYKPRPNRMVLLVQKEVADRIVARDGKESLLSISIKAFGTPRIIAKVGKGAFSPPPKVNSAILAIDDISDKLFQGKNGLPGIEIKRFFEIVRAGFAHKRKFLIRNLETVITQEQLKRTWDKIGLNEKVRAENIFVDQWLKIQSLSI